MTKSYIRHWVRTPLNEAMEEAWSGEGDGPKVSPMVGSAASALKDIAEKMKISAKHHDDTALLEDFGQAIRAVAVGLSHFGWKAEVKPLHRLADKLKKAAKDQGSGESYRY